MTRIQFLLPALLALFVAASGCTYVNQPLNAANVALEARQRNHTRAGAIDGTELSTALRAADTDGYFIGIAISGGGSRSANFAAAAMLQLQRIGLLQRADYISSVSGGSLTAALYCLSDDSRWNPGSVQTQLTHSFASDLVKKIIQPWYTLALMFSDYDRSDMLAESFRDHLFTVNGREMTFADLRSDRPRLLINATDLQSGRRWVFGNQGFDEINSDLAKYPISYAVAASASVPILLHQVTLRDFSTVFAQYRHFIDGGIADNLGVQTLIETYDRAARIAEEKHLPPPYPHGAIFIVIDAKTRFNAQLSDQGDTSLLDSLRFGSGLTSTTLIGRASDATLSDLIVKYSADETTAQSLREQIQQLEKTGFLESKDRHGQTVRILHYALSHSSELSKLPFQNFSESLDKIETYFNIEPKDAYNLYQAASLLMEEKYEPILRPIMKELFEADGRPRGVR